MLHVNIQKWFIAGLLIIAQQWKQCRCPSKCVISITCNIYSAIKKEQTNTWNNLNESPENATEGKTSNPKRLYSR